MALDGVIQVGERGAPLSVLLHEFANRTWDAGITPALIAPDVRGARRAPSPPMADVVVVGAGSRRLAVAARLAKRGHRVTVLERTGRAGGAIHRVEQDGFGWDAGRRRRRCPPCCATCSASPAGRSSATSSSSSVGPHDATSSPTARPSTSPRDRERSRSSAVDAGLGSGSGTAWADFVDGQGETWTLLRQQVLDLPDGGSRWADRGLARQLDSRTSLAKW